MSQKGSASGFVVDSSGIIATSNARAPAGQYLPCDLVPEKVAFQSAGPQFLAAVCSKIMFCLGVDRGVR
jgi:hypothetical protein